MVSRVLVGFGFAAALACMVTGCVHEEQGPEPWASAPVVVAAADAASVKIRIDDNFSLTGRESSEVADKASLKRRLPDALTTKLSAAGFKVVAAGEPADLVLSVDSADLEWTGHFWEARGHVNVSLSRPTGEPPAPAAEDAPAPPPRDPNAPNPGLVARTTAGFDHCDFPNISEVVATSATEQLTRSNELAAWVHGHGAH